MGAKLFCFACWNVHSLRGDAKQVLFPGTTQLL